MKRALTFFTLIAVTFGGMSLALRANASAEFAQSPAERNVVEERGIVALDQSLREVANPFTVMCVAAHPDDIDEGTLAFVHKNLGARTVLVIATRGEGRDSTTRGELDRELAVVRTRETLDAARVLGADLLFLNLKDFGHTKSAEEALSIWGHDEAMRRLVRAIRLLRPDVIITNHDRAASDGQEQAIARLLGEAFTAAGDTKLALEASLEAWQARRLYRRTDEADASVTVNLGKYDEARGRTYADIGLLAHQQLASFGAALDRLTPQRQKSYYKLMASSAGEEKPPGDSLLSGLTVPENLARSVAPPRVGDQTLLEAVGQRERVIDALIEKLIEKRAEGSSEDLHTRYGAEFVRVVRFTETIERSLALLLGIDFQIAIADRVVVPGQKLSAELTLRSSSNRAVAVVFHAPEQVAVEDKKPALKESEAIGLGPFGFASHDVEYEIQKDARTSLPHAEHIYDEEYYPVGSSLPGAQTREPFGHRLLAVAEVGLGQVNITLGALARFDVAPPVEISAIASAIVKDWTKQREIEFPVRVRNRTPGELAGALWVVPLALSEDDYEPAHISFAREDEETTIRLRLRLPILKPPLSPDVLIEFRREKPASGSVLASAKVAVKAVDIETAEGVKVGFIRGLDSSLSLALTELGVEQSEIAINAISSSEHGNGTQTTETLRGCGNLARFDTIIIDGLAYAAHPALVSSSRCLLRYVRQGGNLLVFGQQPDDWNLVLSRTQVMPFAISLSKDRITIETSPVKILDQEHLLMSKPNKVTAQDFDGWVVERAAYLPREWATEYTPLLESGDPGEEPRRSGLLVAKYGEGSFIYTSFAWRQQLLAMNPGAYRVLANLISYPKLVKKQAAPQQ